MNSTSLRFTFCAIALVAIAVLAGASPAFALPVGDVYSFQGYNMPDDNGPTNVTVDGIAENSGGLAINETVVTWLGVPGSIKVQRTGKATVNNTDFSNVGQIVEFELVRNTAGVLSNNTAAGFGFAVGDLDFGTPISLMEDTVYFYFTDSAGKAIPLTPTAKFVSYWGPSPLDPSIEALYTSGVTTLGSKETFADGKVAFDLPPGSTTVATLQSILANPDIHGMRVGALYVIPEPSSIVLAATGIGIALLAARRKFLRK